jgi:hypothetical protein
MGREKKRAKEIIEADSLSAGSPAAEIREETERGAGVGEGEEVLAVWVGSVLGETFFADGSGTALPEGALALVLCRYSSIR